ncbi:MAG: ABC transporter substrate-binding protein [Desulfurococcaceae archaeon]
MKATSLKTLSIALVLIVAIASIGIYLYYVSQQTPSPSQTPVTTPLTTPTPVQTTPIQSTTPTTPVAETVTPTTPVIHTTTPLERQFRLHTHVLYIVSNDETTRIQLFRAGAVDIAEISPSRWRDLNGTPVGNFHLVLEVDPSKQRFAIQFALLNNFKEPLNITEVRQALAWATPYSTILEQVYGGLYNRLYTIVPKGMFGWTDYNIIKYEFDMSKAMSIMEGLKAKGFDPSKYELTIYYAMGDTAGEQIAALLQNTWTQLGFKVFTQPLNWPEFLSKLDHFEFDVGLVGWFPDYLDPDNYLTPFVYGGAEFAELRYWKNVSPRDVGKYLAKVERVIDTGKYIVVVGPKGEGASYDGPSDKPIIVVEYVLDEETTRKNWENPVGLVNMNMNGWIDVPVTALVKLSRMVLDVEVREAVINAAVIVFNHESPMIIFGQENAGRVHGSWVLNMYYPPTTFARYDLVYEDPDAPVVDTGVLGLKNGPEVMAIARLGWPDTFDPAKSYEYFGWEIFWHIYSRPITYYYENTEPEPDLAVAWAFTEDATELYLVIRGGVVAYDPWNNKTYPIDATDVLFSLWRVVRLNLPGSPSWMIYEFIDVDASSVLSEAEFEEVINRGLVTVYKGEEKTVTSLKDLLEFFNYTGNTAGVVKLRLKIPYPPILHILATAVASVIPMEYALGDNYAVAVADSNNGKDPSAWAKYVIEGEDDPSHRLLKDRPVSTGPYYVASYLEDSYILLKINPYYWNSKIWEELYGYIPSIA